MAAPTLCLYNKFGYCKFSERCRKHHVNEICENTSCSISECRQRHPKICRYFDNYGRCKFFPCAFKHETRNSIIVNEERTFSENYKFIENEIKEKSRMIDELSTKICSLETKISDLENKIGTLSTIEEKIKEFDERFVKICEGLDKTMEFFGDRFKDFAVDIDDLAVELNDDIGNLTVENVDVPLDQTFKNPFLAFKCDICDFSAKSERGLKTHKTRKHINCNWCDLICKDESELKKHKMDKHSLEYSVELLQNYYI